MNNNQREKLKSTGESLKSQDLWRGRINYKKCELGMMLELGFWDYLGRCLGRTCWMYNSTEEDQLVRLTLRKIWTKSSGAAMLSSLREEISPWLPLREVDGSFGELSRDAQHTREILRWCVGANVLSKEIWRSKNLECRSTVFYDSFISIIQTFLSTKMNYFTSILIIALRRNTI